LYINSEFLFKAVSDADIKTVRGHHFQEQKIKSTLISMW